MYNAKLVWQKEITIAKVGLARNQHTLRLVEERIRKREEARPRVLHTGKAIGKPTQAVSTESFQAACAEAHEIIGKDGNGAADTVPILPTKESEKRTAHSAGFDSVEDEIDDGFSAFQEAEIYEAAWQETAGEIARCNPPSPFYSTASRRG